MTLDRRTTLLAGLCEQRSNRFPEVPTLRQKGIDVSVSTWRGSVAPKRTPRPVVDTLRGASRKAADEAEFRDALARLDRTHAWADAPAFQKVIERDNAFFKGLMSELGIAK